MLKTRYWGWVLVFVMVLAAGSAVASATAKAELPVLITSIGQSAEVLTAGFLAERAGLEHTVMPQATADDIDGFKSVILSVGVSLKGFGAAGTDRHTEETRAAQLLAAAKEKGVPVILLFTGGDESRDGGIGPLTMHFVTLTAPQADMLIIWADADLDGYFTTLSKQKDIPMIQMRQVFDLPDIYKELFNL